VVRRKSGEPGTKVDIDGIIRDKLTRK